MKKSLFLILAMVIITVAFVQSGSAQISLSATAGTLSGSYSTLKGAFDKINDGTHRGVITISVTANTLETATAALNETGYGSANYTSVGISPSGARTITGDISTSLIYLKAADNVTIDGLNDGTNSLTLVNTNTAENSNYGKVVNAEGDLSGGVVKSIENFLITRCTIQGNTLATPYLSVQGYYGCNNVSITNCDFGPYSTNYTSQVVYTYGESYTTPKITNLIFTGNKIHDFGSPNAFINYGLNLRYINGGSIANNKLYQTTPRIISYTGYEPYFYYVFMYGCKNLPVTGNVIGYANESGTGITTLSFTGTLSYMHVYGIYNYKYSNAPINISQNEIAGLSVTFNHPQYSSTFDAIYLDGNTTVANTVYTINDNIVGSLTVDGSIILESNGGPLSFSGISSKYNGTHVTTAVVSGNRIGGINSGTVNNPSYGGFNGIAFATYVNASSVVNITNNIVGSPAAPMIIGRSSTTNDLSISGINMVGSSDNGKVPYTISGNIVQNLVNYQNDDSYGYYTNGINDPENGSLYYHRVVSHNVVRNIQSQGGIRGIGFGNSGNYNVVIEYNEVYALSGGRDVSGISYPGNSGTLKNNFVYGIASTAPTSYNTYGIYFFYNPITPLNLTTNNIIVIGKDGSGNNIGGNLLYGIYDGYTSSSYYYNTVVLVGQATSGSSNSYSFFRNWNTDNGNSIIENNIFVNLRSNNGCTGKHYAIQLNTSTNLTIDYNDYYAPNSGGVLGGFGGSDKATLALWKTATGQDVNSLNTNPSFANAGGTSPCDYKPSAVLNGTAIGSVTTDYYDVVRTAPPSMGALEVTYNIWTGTTSTDWNTAGNWSNAAVPTGSDDATIPGPPTNQPTVNQDMGTPAVCNNLTLASGAVLTLAAGKALTVNGTLTNNAGTTGLVISSDATGTGSLIHNTANVNASIKRYITGSSDLTIFKYHFVSVPLTAAAAPTSNLFLGSYLENFSESANDWVKLGASTSTPLDVTMGYMIYYPDASITYTFPGPLNSGTFTALTSYTPGNGYNLVPNPYPSSIDWDASGGWTKTNFDNAVYIWPSSAGAGATASNYASYVNGASTNDGSRYISTGQSFFVHANAATPLLTMDNGVRIHNAVSFLKNTETISNMLRIHTVARNAEDEIVVRFTGAATTGFDGEWDAYKMQGGADAPQLSSVASDNSNLSINSMPFSTGDVNVPLKFSLNTNADVTFTASGMETFNENVPIYLEDLSLGKTVNLRLNPLYAFSYETGNTADRFRLHFAGPIGKEEHSAHNGKAFISNGHLFIDVPGMNGRMAEIRVYNALGQLIKTDQVMMNGVVTVDVPETAGILIIHVGTPEKNFVTKVINRH